MMKKAIFALLLWVGMHSAALAMTIAEQLLASLKEQGYVIIEEGYTFLGRLRIVAERDGIRREIVVNPGTGEILRDYVAILPKNLLGEDSGPSANSLQQDAPMKAPVSARAPVVDAEQDDPDPSAPVLDSDATQLSPDVGATEPDATIGAALDVIMDDPIFTGETARE